MTREIVAKYGGVRAMLWARLQAGREIAVEQRVAVSGTSTGGPCGYGDWPAREKVPGKDEYVFAPRGTNNPQGARVQREQHLWESVDRLESQYEQLYHDVNDLINQAYYGVDRTILRYYYCADLNDDEIAFRMNYSRSNVNKRRGLAIAELEKRYG